MEPRIPPDDWSDLRAASGGLLPRARQWLECVADLLCRHDLPDQPLYPLMARLRDALHRKEPLDAVDALDALKQKLVETLRRACQASPEQELLTLLRAHPAFGRESKLLALLGYLPPDPVEANRARWQASLRAARSLAALLGVPPPEPGPRGPDGGSAVPTRPPPPRRRPGKERRREEEL